jgi:hypothetical protein
MLCYRKKNLFLPYAQIIFLTKHFTEYLNKGTYLNFYNPHVQSQ